MPTADALKNLLIQLQYNITEHTEVEVVASMNEKPLNSLKRELEKSSTGKFQLKQPQVVIKFYQITADSQDATFSFSRLVSQVRSYRSRKISSNIILANAREIAIITSAVRER